jgi:hypothetical protein
MAENRKKRGPDRPGKTLPGGFTLLEASVCLFIVAMVTGFTFVSVSHILPKIKFKSQASDIKRMFELASYSASETPRRYGVMVDFMENACILYEVSTSRPYSENFETLRDEDIMDIVYLSQDCQLYYVQFDDSEETIDATAETGRAFFVAGRAGWDYGGKVVFFDNEGMLHSILIHRLGNNIQMYDYDVMIPEPVFNLPF